MTRALSVLALIVVAGMPREAVSQEGAADLGRRLLEDSAVRRAVDHARDHEHEVIADQVRLCEIPAPPFQEEARAEAYRARLAELGLTDVRVDAEGNVLGERRGTGDGPRLVFSAHLDTVFPEGTDVTVTRDGPVLRGPGIGDDCRGLAVVLAVARALDAAGVETPGTITFVGTVGEEGLGNLRGVRHLFETELDGRIDRFVSVDGSGQSVAHIGVGSRRYRVTYRGPGGHSYGAFGLVNPVHALGRAMAAIADFEVPAEPKTTFSVGRIGGGTSVNAIAHEAWMEVDMRSEDPDALAALDARFLAAIDEATALEDARWSGTGSLAMEAEVVGDRPAGRMPADAPIVQAALSVTRALGYTAALRAGSTDSNLPMSLGVPAITIGGGGRGTGAHSLDEAFDTTDSWQGTARAVLLAIALAQP